MVQLFLQNDLAAHLYYSSEASTDDSSILVDNLVIFFPGLPQFVDKRFFQDKVLKNTAYLSVYYYGTWLSGETFTPDTARKTVKDAIEFARGGRGLATYNSKSFHWKYRKLQVLGCSFAGNSIITSGISKADVAGIELYNPLIYLENGDKSQLPAFDGEAFDNLNRQFLQFMRNGYCNVLRGIDSEVWNNYFFGKDPASKIMISGDLPQIKIYQGLDDTTLNPAWSKYFCESNKSICEYVGIEGVGHDFVSAYNIINRNGNNVGL